MMRDIGWDPRFPDRSPMFEPFTQFNKFFADQHNWPTHSDLNYLNFQQRNPILTQSGKLISFVPQIYGKKNLAQKYESKIFLTGEIQTREKNWHDFFNALVWQIFPEAKSALNYRHYQVQLIEDSDKINQRSSVRDAATLFDESGVVVISSEVALIHLLRNHEWKQLFWQNREAVLSFMRFFVFGHGLYEKALNPYIGMTGKGISFMVSEAFFTFSLPDQLRSIDSMLRPHILQSLTASSDLMPVPLLGYPGWSKDNHGEVFYDNTKYFRNRNRLKSEMEP